MFGKKKVHACDAASFSSTSESINIIFILTGAIKCYYKTRKFYDKIKRLLAWGVPIV